MKLFGCESCGQVAFFENNACVKCGHGLVYDPERALLRTLRDEAAGDGVVFLHETSPTHRKCANAALADCNWLVRVGDEQKFCISCRLNRTIPNLSDDTAHAQWKKIEVAKRRLVYTALSLHLPLEPRSATCPNGLLFDILQPVDGAPVMTGHADGVITLNLSEADDPFREQVRVNLGEPYRTLLGHLRHEVGHYYWERLVSSNEQKLAACRDVFGDDGQSYDEALKRHYENGAPADWHSHFISAYASMHPWEDWAETWAHYLHIVDTMETAHAYGLRLSPKPEAVAALDASVLQLRPRQIRTFDDLMADWYPLTFALNSLNRSMGHHDWYPFVLPDAALSKLRFVHDLVSGLPS